MRDHTKLRAFEMADEVVVLVYKFTAGFPKEELYGLTSQIRRAAVSIPANIAEGCSRGGDAEFSRFLCIAQGSAAELDYHLLLARDLQYLEQPAYKQLCVSLTEVRRMLTTFIQKLKSS